MAKKNNNRLFRLLNFTGKWKPVYFLGLVGVGLQSLAMNYIVSLGLKGLAEASISKDMDALYITLLNLGLQLGAFVLIIPIFFYAFDSSIKRTTANIRKQLFKHIQRLPMKYIEENHSGDLLSRMTNDVQTAENAYGWQLSLLVMSTISGLGSIVVISSLNIWLAVAAVLIGVTCLLVNTLFIKPLKKVSDRVQGHLSESVQVFTDILAGSSVAKIFNLNSKLFAYYTTACLGIKKDGMKRVMYQSILNGASGFAFMMSFIGMMALSSVMIINGKISMGDIMIVIQMMSGIVWMFSSIGNFIAQLQGSLAGADRIFQVLDAPIEVGDSSVLSKNPGNQMPNVRKNGDSSVKVVSSETDGDSSAISFKDVHFSYDPDKIIIDGFSADIKQNEVTALVGMSGSGKSTLFKLLLGFYPQTEGEIKMFGCPLKDYSLEELRSLIAYVPQTSYLFNGTIEDNIAYGKPGASFEEIQAAAKAAFADGFINELPKGYQTQVGERGALLSGGQRQRIAIARALLKDAPILLLDEATASLDTESEQQVQKALETLMKNRTTLVVAHRLSTIQNANRILVMDNGRICEDGTHESLLHLDKIYARLSKIQFKDTETAELAIS